MNESPVDCVRPTDSARLIVSDLDTIKRLFMHYAKIGYQFSNNKHAQIVLLAAVLTSTSAPA